MYKIRKRGEIFYTDISVNNHRVRRSTGTNSKTKAAEIARKWEAELIDKVKLGKSELYVWQDAVVRWSKENERKDKVTDLGRLKALSPYLMHKELNSISADFIWQSIDKISEERERERENKKALTSSTKNKYMGLVRAILRCCKGWGWVSEVPSFKKRKEPTKRVRWIAESEALTLIAVLPQHQRNPVKFALLTGLRKANIYGLEWTQIDLQRRIAWIHADQAKAGKNISVPLSKAALEVLKDQKGKHERKVFPIEIGNGTFERACKKAGISNFRFHDLRHTWASWHVQSGTSLQELMELGGWHSFEMVLRYAHLKADHLQNRAELVGTNLSH